MNEFFKSMHQVANLNDKSYTSIKELVTDLANSAGYHTEMVTVGQKEVCKTRYCKKWDDTLVAKWYCYYEKAFRKVFFQHPEFKNDFTDFILTRVYHSFFSALKLEKLTSDASVNSLFNLTLANRIGEAIFLIGSPAKLEANIKTKEDNDKFIAETGTKVKFSKRKCYKNTAINYNAISLNMLFEGENNNKTSKHSKFKEPSSSDILSSDCIIDLKRILRNNEYGEKVLYALLYSDKKFKVNKIKDFIDIKDEGSLDYALSKIRDAYKTIANYLYNSLEKNSSLKSNLEKSYKFMQRNSFDKKFNYGNELSL